MYALGEGIRGVGGFISSPTSVLNKKPMRPALELHLLRGFCFLASQQSLLTIAVKLIPFSLLNTSKIELTPSSGFLGLPDPSCCTLSKLFA